MPSTTRSSSSLGAPGAHLAATTMVVLSRPVATAVTPPAARHHPHVAPAGGQEPQSGDFLVVLVFRCVGLGQGRPGGGKE